jgi:thiol-disulfide isomerase/thioredoxin
MAASFWKPILLGVALVLLLAAVAMVALFKLVQHRIAARLSPPVLEQESWIVPDITYRTLDGSVRHLSSSRGQVVFLNLWGTWCIPCVAEMPTRASIVGTLSEQF